MVGDDEDDTAASESFGSFGGTSKFIASCVQNKTDFKSMQLILHYILITPNNALKSNQFDYICLVNKISLLRLK